MEKKHLTYISLFSGAGVGCYGFKEEQFQCIATVELMEKRLKVQRYNHKCHYKGGYICGDMTKQETKDKIFGEISHWKQNFGILGVDVLIATPPCQGMSVANHKKKNEINRNSLVVESIFMVKEVKPKFFVFENVKTFLHTLCTDIDDIDKPIQEAIDSNLAGDYNILYRVVNFKDYGSPSSRTRTLVIGVRKDLKEVTPYDVFPSKQPERTLKDVIGDLPSLKIMGEISPNDIYHSFKRYSPNMESWISEIKEGQSAFDNIDESRKPHSIKNGTIVYNTQKNGDKYTRQCWDRVAPCIHTRNDILASQNTVHPSDNRVFSIREVMRLMSVPNTFKWSDKPFDRLNSLTIKEKEEFLKKEEMNIRQNLGEAVPTIIFRQIAKKIKTRLNKHSLTEKRINDIITQQNLKEASNLLNFIKTSKDFTFAELSKVAELSNAQRDSNAAYYTRQDVCYAIIKSLPDFKGKKAIRILEPSIGVGNFIPSIIKKYEATENVYIDVVDIDTRSLDILKSLIAKINIPTNFHFRYINDDFLLHKFEDVYDVVIGNPPYMKLMKGTSLLTKYRSKAFNKETNNMFAFFIEKAMKVGRFVSLIVPKSLISAPEFGKTRQLLNEFALKRVIDFGEKGFKGVKIETVCIQVDLNEEPSTTIIESYISHSVEIKEQMYISSADYPYWLIYRNERFDSVARLMTLGVFKVFRDRRITKSITLPNGKYRVLKSRNIGSNEIINIEGYDSYIDSLDGLDVARYLNKTDCVLFPNLTYNPRACFMPKGCVADGSVAILTCKDKQKVRKKDIAFYASKEFEEFYSIARNRGTRSLNIDSNSVFFLGILK